MKKIGFIGYGNMGKMILNNILKLNIIPSNEMIVSNRTIAKLNDLKEKYPDILITDDNIFLAQNSYKLFIFVETPEFKNLLDEISPYLDDDCHIIHVCAGLSFDNIFNLYKGSVSQVIPSIISTFNEKYEKFKFGSSGMIEKLGVTLISHNKYTSNENKEFVEEIFNEFSYIELIDDFSKDRIEDYMGNNNSLEIATILASCGPAFISLIIDKLAEIASLQSENNINSDKTKEIITKTLLGTLIQIDTNNISTDEIIKMTATKKGITEIGLNYLDNNFEELSNGLFDVLLKRYGEVKRDLANEYSKL
ncbi:MAG: NAD(P)-binding domain-containing protein [Methanobrevibacter sp.]|nr:NAD(P)-binding domain-containing protein [Methanobrevibacter sp.]